MLTAGGLTGIIGTPDDDVITPNRTVPGQPFPTAIDDTIHGLGGNDTLNGGAGNDTLYGGAGNDVYVVSDVGDVVSETDPLTGTDAGGTDRVLASVDHVLTAHVEHLTLTGAAIEGTGNGLDNRITGNALNNRLVGLAGDDTLNGMAGADTLIGGEGDDVYYIDDSGDLVEEQAGEGWDRVVAAIDHVLGDHLEALILSGAALRGTGNALDNRLDGNALNNRLFGLDGNDTLRGREGDDTMYGGAGDDTYIVDSTGDRVVEAAGEGYDIVVSSVDYGLSAHVERLDLTGTAIRGSGNSGDNRIHGNAEDNRLFGGAGNDSLVGREGNDLMHGGAGADVMAGGVGDDQYRVDDLGDVVREYAGEGIDTVVSTIDYTLGDHVEILYLRDAAVRGTGNALDNRIDGNDLGNLLVGAEGDDTLLGRDGDDTIEGGLGADRMNGGAGADQFVFRSSAEHGDRIFDFTSGEDSLVLHAAGFGDLGSLVLADAFVFGTSAADADDRLIYDLASGRLFWDEDGVGGADQLMLLRLAPGVAFGVGDILLA